MSEPRANEAGFIPQATELDYATAIIKLNRELYAAEKEVARLREALAVVRRRCVSIPCCVDIAVTYMDNDLEPLHRTFLAEDR